MYLFYYSISLVPFLAKLLDIHVHTLCTTSSAHSLLCSLLLGLCVHPFNEICLIDITKDLYAVKSNGIFSAVNFLDFSF